MMGEKDGPRSCCSAVCRPETVRTDPELSAGPSRSHINHIKKSVFYFLPGRGQKPLCPGQRGLCSKKMKDDGEKICPYTEQASGKLWSFAKAVPLEVNSSGYMSFSLLARAFSVDKKIPSNRPSLSDISSSAAPFLKGIASRNRKI